MSKQECLDYMKKHPGEKFDKNTLAPIINSFPETTARSLRRLHRDGSVKREVQRCTCQPFLYWVES